MYFAHHQIERRMVAGYQFAPYDKLVLGVNLEEMLEWTKCCVVCDACRVLRNGPGNVALVMLLASLPAKPTVGKEKVAMEMLQGNVRLLRGWETFKCPWVLRRWGPLKAAWRRELF